MTNGRLAGSFAMPPSADGQRSSTPDRATELPMATTALQTGPQPRPTPCSLLASREGLAKLVDEVQPGIQQRRPTPAERDDLGKLLPRYEAALVPADRSKIEDAVTMLAMAYPAMRATVNEADARLELYTQGLADVPADILNNACQLAIRELRFFPTIAELRERCHGLAQRQWRTMRIRELIDRYDREKLEDDQAPRCTPEEAASIIADMGLKLDDGPVKRAMPQWMKDALACQSDERAA